MTIRRVGINTIVKFGFMSVLARVNPPRGHNVDRDGRAMKWTPAIRAASENGTDMMVVMLCHTLGLSCPR